MNGILSASESGLCETVSQSPQDKNNELGIALIVLRTVSKYNQVDIVLHGCISFFAE